MVFSGARTTVVGVWGRPGGVQLAFCCIDMFPNRGWWRLWCTRSDFGGMRPGPGPALLVRWSSSSSCWCERTLPSRPAWDLHMRRSIEYTIYYLLRHLQSVHATHVLRQHRRPSSTVDSISGSSDFQVLARLPTKGAGGGSWWRRILA